MPLKMSVEPLSQWPIPVSGKFFIAGPCSVESEAQIRNIAAQLSRHPVTALRGGIWKPRTHPGSFEGIGAKGLRWLVNAGRAAGLPVATEVATAAHVEHCLKAGVDLLWVGARTTANPFNVQELADALRGVDVPVMIKNPINPDIELWIGACERLSAAGCKKIAAIHRGFCTYRRNQYRNQPIWRIPIKLRRLLPQIPIICDPSHISGDRKHVFSIAQEAMDFLFDGLMIEVHNDPDAALSDGMQQITPAQYGKMVGKLRQPSVDSSRKPHLRKIESLRGEIDVIDDDLIALLAKRMECVRGIGILKRDNNLPLLQIGRWKQILFTRLRKSGRKHLSRSFINEIFEGIHEEALRIQEEIQK